VRRLRWKGKVLLISGATGAGTEELKQAVMHYLEEHPRQSRYSGTDDEPDAPTTQLRALAAGV